MTVITPADAVATISATDMLSALTDLARVAEEAAVTADLRGNHKGAFACWLAGAAYRSDIAQIHERIAGLPCVPLGGEVA